MITSYDSLTIDNVASIGFDDPEKALRLLQDLGGHDIPDDDVNFLIALLTTWLRKSADPDRALAGMHAYLDAAGSRVLYYRMLTSNAALLAALLNLFAASQFLTDLLVKNPEYFEVIANPTMRDRPRSMADFLADAERRIAVARTPGMKLDALRRFKPPEVLRIGARDILGYATLTETVTEISDFAEASVRAALKICEIDSGFAVIGMGKLGGRELNYASDIDLIFVHDDSVDQVAANKMGEAVRDVLAANTAAGFVFRVDLRLRPEGRFGSISRSLSGCRSYYESWAETWERQALLKARVVAGDEAVGAEFMRIAEAFVFRSMVQSDFVTEIQNNKRMLERQTARSGEAESNVKQGIGGIRDIEFTVQLLQLIAGGKAKHLRTGNTIEALKRLVAEGLLSEDERLTFEESYVFLRNVEHRLQIMDERPVRTIPPPGTRECDRFGWRLGLIDGASFIADYRRHTKRVNELFQKIFYGSDSHLDSVGSGGSSTEFGIADLVRSIDDPASSEGLSEVLRNLGFERIDVAIDVLTRSEKGTAYGEFIPAAREGFEAIVDDLLTACAASGYPDDALSGFDHLAEAVPSRAALYRSLVEQPEFLGRMAVMGGCAPHLFQTVLAHLEYLDMLGELTEHDTASSGPILASASDDIADYQSSLAAGIRRERLRIGARDLWDLTDTASVSLEISSLADNVLAAAPRLPEYEDIRGQLGIVGLGKLGGRELGYASDLDVLWVLADGGDRQRATSLAMDITALLNQGLARYGVRWETDARLRPDGRVGTLVRTVDDYEAYYRTPSAQTWERQALLKARYVAGNTSAGRAFEAMAHGIVYSEPLTVDQAADMRHMKGRIERERCKDPRDIKLGPGGLSDIEWTAQYLQWRYGARWPKARSTNTLAALKAVRDAGVLRQDDWEVLSDTYLVLTKLRNRAWLRDGRGSVVGELEESVTDARQKVREIYERIVGLN
ncbi:MAG TPA: hypothetical protein VGK19_04760 [Capsulimonadaceae bacterium]|jgi:glutamate-ammonia-ligase adenylyltransferase